MPASYFDADLTEMDNSVSNGIRAALGIGGLVALVLGLALLFWPGIAAVVATWIIAAYALIAGVVNLAIGVFSRKIGGWPRTGYLASGALFVIVAVVVFVNIAPAAKILAIAVGIVVGVAWIVEGIVALTLIKDAGSKTWTIIYAALSIIAGIVLLFSPLYIAVLVWVLGIALAVMGVVQIVRAFRFSAV